MTYYIANSAWGQYEANPVFWLAIQVGKMAQEYQLDYMHNNKKLREADSKKLDISQQFWQWSCKKEQRVKKTY